jgi:hypothetical protein
MTTSNEFENFVYEVCKELGTPRAIVVHGNKTYHGRVSRRKISVDVSFDAQLLGARIFGLVECKCYKSRVGVSDSIVVMWGSQTESRRYYPPLLGK